MEEYIVSARKYRPSAFDSVVGQSALTTTLKNAIASGKLAHAYLFCGPRGVGKTTCARIFAKTINCLSPSAEGEACNHCESCMAFNEQRSLNIHELDAASNNSVEDIRALIEQVRIPPQVGRYKVFIIDEVHMLSTAAFNAFLKTLEEPPAHVIFILATTEKHKILPTILSRCQIYDFNRMTVEGTVKHLAHVADNEGYTYETEALNVIARKADGGMRDALSIFDQVASFTGGNITYRQTIENLNVLDYEYYFRLTDHFLKNEVAQCMLLFNEVLEHGFEGSHFISGLASHLRDLMVSKDESTLSLLEAGNDVRARFREQAQRCPDKFLYRAIKLCNDCDLNYRTSKNKRLLVEITLIQAAQLTEGDDETGAGRCPANVLLPIFKADAQAKPGETDNRTGNQTTASATVTSPTGAQATTTGSSTPHPTLPPVQETSVRKPTIRLNALSPSIRRPSPAVSTATTPGTSSAAMAQEPATVYANEDYMVTEKDITFYWHEFANLLPQEETAMAQRMKILRPHLLQDETFEVVVDNEQVKTYMQQITPRIEKHMRTQLHNRRITMQVRVAENAEETRIYSKPELFQMMLRKSPDLDKLKEVFNLELA